MASGWRYSKSSRRPLPSGVCSMAILAWLPSRPTAVSAHSPSTVARPWTVSPRSVKKAMVASRSRTAMPTFSSLMGMRCTLASSAGCSPAGEAQRDAVEDVVLADDDLGRPQLVHDPPEHERARADGVDPA